MQDGSTFVRRGWETINETGRTMKDWEATRDCDLIVCILFRSVFWFFSPQRINFCLQYDSLCKLYSLFNKTLIERVNVS